MRPLRSLCMITLGAAWLLSGSCGDAGDRSSATPAQQDTLLLGADVDSVDAAMEAGEFVRTDSLARAALARLKPEDPPVRREVLLWRLGTSLHQRGLEDTARAVLQEALDMARAAADSLRGMSIQRDLAAVLTAQGDYPPALQLMLEALAYQERLHDTMRMANTISTIAKVYYMQDDDSAALAEYRHARDLYASVHDSIGMSIALNNISNALIEKGDHDSAIAILRYNVHLRQRIMHKRSRAPMEANFSRAFLGLGQADSALQHGELALAQARAHEQSDLQALAWINIARAQRAQARYAEALRATDSSRVIAAKLNRPEQVQEAHKTFYLIHKDQGNYRDALAHAERFHAIDDSLVNAQRNAEMLELRTRYAVQQKERDNDRLRAEADLAAAQADSARSGQLALAAGLLATLLGAWALLQRWRQRAREREMDLEQQVLRSQMDPHFLFNALNTVPGLYASGDVAAANDHVGHLSRFLRAVLETGRRRTVSLAQELELVEHYLRICENRTPGHFTWAIHVGSDVLPERVAVPPILLQPLVENAIEHGLAGVERGHIGVNVERNGDHITIEVLDDGVGAVAAAARPIRRSGTSMGLELVRQRLALFDRRSRERSTLQLQDRATNGQRGTRVVLRLYVKHLSEHAAIGDRG